MHICAYFCYKCRITGYLPTALWALWNGSIFCDVITELDCIKFKKPYYKDKPIYLWKKSLWEIAISRFYTIDGWLASPKGYTAFYSKGISSVALENAKLMSQVLFIWLWYLKCQFNFFTWRILSLKRSQHFDDSLCEIHGSDAIWYKPSKLIFHSNLAKSTFVHH